MATLSQIMNKVQQKLGLDSSSGSAEETLLIQWVNEAVVDVLLRARCNVNVASMAAIAGEADYTLPTGILAIQDVTYTTSQGTRQMRRATPDDILRYRTVTPSVGASVSHYALNGADLLMLYPTPQAADTIDIYYVPRPTAMEIPADPSSETYGGIPTEYHKALELYALAEAAEFTDHQPSQFGQMFRLQYEQKLVEIKRAMRHRGGRSLGPATVGRRRPLVGANDVYPRP